MSITAAMTARFTPPTDCSTSWTYEPSANNGVSGGLLQNLAGQDVWHTSCWPSGEENWGRGMVTQVFSPGWCPDGYTSAVLGIAQDVTTVSCCLSDFEYTSDAEDYVGCTSIFPSGSTTTVTLNEDAVYSNMTVVTGPITMWAQAVVVEYKSSDLSLFVSATTTSSIISTTSATQPRSTSTSKNTSMTTSTSSSTTTSTSTSTTVPSSSHGLSTGAKDGIGIGVGVGVLAVMAFIAVLLFLRRRKHLHHLIETSASPVSPDEGIVGPGHGYSASQDISPRQNFTSELDGGNFFELSGKCLNEAPSELDGYYKDQVSK